MCRLADSSQCRATDAVIFHSPGGGVSDMAAPPPPQRHPLPRPTDFGVWKNGGNGGKWGKLGVNGGDWGMKEVWNGGAVA